MLCVIAHRAILFYIVQASRYLAALYPTSNSSLESPLYEHATKSCPNGVAAPGYSFAAQSSTTFMDPVNHTSIEFFVPLLVQFFFIFGIIGCAVGIGLVITPVRMHALFGVMNHWVSMRRNMKWIAKLRDSGSPSVPFFRGLLGVVFIIAAIFSTFVLTTQIDVNRVVDAIGVNMPRSFVAMLIECVRWFLIVGNLLAIAVGIMLMFFPQVLSVIEKRTNRWYSIRSHTQGGDTMVMAFDRWIESNPKTMGLIIAVGSAGVAINFGILLFAHS